MRAVRLPQARQDPEVRGRLSRHERLCADVTGAQAAGQLPAADTGPGRHPKSVQDEMLVAAFNDIAMVESLIEEQKDELAGVIVEPFQRPIPPKPGFPAGAARGDGQRTAFR